MKIISKFHDYYDSVQRQGMDKDVVYVRERKEMLIKNDFKVCDRPNHSTSNGSASLKYLGFCGHIYKLYVVSTKQGDFYQVLYNFEEFKEVSQSLGITGKYDFGRRWWKSKFDEFFESNTEPLQELFHKYQVPIFLIETSTERNKQKLILNPNLKELDFQTIKDTYTAYQDIYQYVAGVLNSPENKMVKISDKDKIAKHGFDKHSFRKLPTKK